MHIDERLSLSRAELKIGRFLARQALRDRILARSQTVVLFDCLAAIGNLLGGFLISIARV